MDARQLIAPRLLCLLALLVGFPAAAAQWAISDPGQGPFSLPGDSSGAFELSGLGWAGGNQYGSVSDNDSKLYPLTIDLNPDGTISSAALSSGITMTGGSDLEGVAYPTGAASVFVASEGGPGLREHVPATGALLNTFSLPAVFSNIRPNLSLESLALDTTTQKLWVANEEALSVDGPVSGFAQGTVVRLQRFDAGRNADGQWAYVTDPLPADISAPGRDVESSGVAELIAPPGGDLLVLERASGGGGAFLRTRIYQVDFNGASDISALPSLDGASYTAVSKSLLWAHSEVFYNFEGAALGPTLSNGRSLILVSDDGNGLQQGLYALVLREAVCGNGTVEAPESCDDSNAIGGDGCSATCRLEVCGDGAVNNNGTEHCDDGNVADDDGCTATCRLERAPRRCQEAILKAARSYGLDRLKALRRCHDQFNRGQAMFLDDAETVPLSDPADCSQEVEARAAISKAGTQLRIAIADPDRARCTNGDAALLTACGDTLDGLVSPLGDGGCLVTSHDTATDQIVDAEYGRLLAPDESALRKCQETIGKVASKYAAARWQALNACQTQLFKERALFSDQARTLPLVDPNDCASEFKTARKLSRAAAKVRQSIASPGREACTDALLSALASTCATTLDGLVSPAGDGGCLIDSHDAAVAAAVAAEQ